MKSKASNINKCESFVRKSQRKLRDRICSCLFCSTTKTVINFEYNFGKYSQEIL